MLTGHPYNVPSTATSTTFHASPKVSTYMEYMEEEELG